MAAPGKKIGALKRIVKLYGAVEQMHSVALRQASAAVTVVDHALATEEAMTVAARASGREALGSGDRGEWMFSEAQREMAGWRREKLTEVRETRLVVREEARVEFVGSRLKTEQMKQVVSGLIEKAKVDEGRRVQAAADDRFLARQRWLAGREDGGRVSRDGAQRDSE